MKRIVLFNSKNMEKEIIKEYAEGFAEKRIESAIQSFNGLLKDFEFRLLESVSNQVKTTVNGKIDSLRAENREHHERQQTEIENIKKTLESVDLRIQPFEHTRTWFEDAKKGAGWIAGFLTSLTLIAGAIVYLIKKIIIFK